MQHEVRQLERSLWPPLLTEMSDPPKQLYVRGELPSFESKWLAVVGSRALSKYGEDACKKLIAGLSGYPIVIVSGLALGTDACAHIAALDAKLPTVAVPGSGLADTVLYPRTNRYLAKKILEHGGALLSEFEPEFKATPWSFPQRNRIMAGLSHATLVIEAGEKSGTLITSRLATEYNRDVFTVPGPIFNPHSAGPNMLLRLGATPITKSEDILEAFGFESRVAEGDPATKAIETLPPLEQKIISLIGLGHSRDEIIRTLGLPPSQASATFVSLELRGFL